MIGKLSKEKYNRDEIIKKWNECNYNEDDKCISEVNNDTDILDWFMRIKEKFNLKCSFEEFEKTYYQYGEKIVFYSDAVDFAHHLKDKCQIGILSNLCKLDYSRIDKHYQLSKFDYVWLSYELNCKKPNSHIYELVEESCQINPCDILFIDDSGENIKVAKKRGWNVCLATGQTLNKIKESVDEFLK